MGWFWNRKGVWTRRKKLAVSALVLIPIAGIASVEVTSQSWFCNSCHIMGPYYDSWKQGSHKDVPCVKCHIAPGVDNFLAAKFNGLGQVVDDLLHRTSTKPSASVSQLACTRPGCHSEETVRASSTSSGMFKFRHDKHLGLEYAGVLLACGTCHSHIKGSEHFEVNTEICIACHLVQAEPAGPALMSPDGTAIPRSMISLSVREGRTTTTAGHGTDAGSAGIPPNTCTTCHDPPTGTLVHNGLKVNHAQYLVYGAACESCHRSATVTPEPITDGRCLACHTYGIERVGDPVQLHKLHLEGRHKIECFSCHGTLQHGTTAQVASLEQFDCRRCHQDQHSIQRNEYVFSTAHTANGAPAVSPMFMAHVDCNGCHTTPRAVSARPESGATVAIATAEACNDCHQAGFGEQMIPLWQKATKSLYERVEADLKAAEALAGTDSAKLDKARRVLQLIRVDGSWGVHNPKYTQQLLQDARESLSAARGAAGGAP